MALRTVGVRLAAEISSYTYGLRQAAKETRGFAGELSKAAKAGQLDAVADQAARVGLAITAMAAGMVYAAAGFEKQMSSVKAVTQSTAQDMELLRQAALDAGRDTQFSALKAAEGIEELAKAGVATTDILGGGLKGALALAAAGQIDVGEAAEIAASAMVQFQLAGNQVTHIADLLAAGANKAQGGVRDLSQALNQSGLVAAQMGLTIEETTGALAGFASAGLLGSDAGTSFKTMLLRLAAPTDTARAKMDDFGISAFDAQGKFIGMSKFAGNLETSLAGLSREQQLATMNTIFGTDAIRAASITFQQGERGIQNWIDAVDDSGYASKVAADKMDNLAGDIEFLKGSLETLAIQAGGGTSDALRQLAQGAAILVNQIGELPAGLQSTAVMVAGLTGVLLLGFAGWVKMTGAVARASAELAAIGPRGAAAGRALQTTTKWAGRAAAAFVALQIAGVVMEMMGDGAAEVDKLAKSLKNLALTGEMAGEMTRVFGERGGTSFWAAFSDQGDLEGLVRDMNLVDTSGAKAARSVESILPPLKGLGDLINGANFTDANANIQALDAALVQMVQSGDLTAARTAHLRIMQEAGRTLDDMERLLPGYTEAMREAQTQTTAAAIAEKRAADNAKLLAGGMLEAEQAGKSLTDVFEDLHAATNKWARSEISAEAALDDLTESLKDNGKTLNVNTAKGRENLSAILDMTEAAIAAAQAKYEETGSIGDANKIYGDYIKRLKDTLLAAGFTKDQVDKLIKKYAEMPKAIATTVTAPGLDSAITKHQRLLELRRLLGSNVAAANVDSGSGYTAGRRWGGITEHARDGLLREAQTFSSAQGTRYAFAEPATGGEAFVPKNGNPKRSLGILDQAAGWYGHQLMPAGGGIGGGGGSIHITVSVEGGVTITGTGIASGIRQYVDLKGAGSVQKAFGRKGRG